MKRRWFQIHLSTAVVMMLTAAAFIGLNTYAYWWHPDSPFVPGVVYPYVTIVGCGWPCVAYQGELSTFVKPITDSSDLNFIVYDSDFPGSLILSGVLINLVCLIAIVFLVGFFCEYQIRRRERGRLPEGPR
jgi:hypothetical protein